MAEFKIEFINEGRSDSIVRHDTYLAVTDIKYDPTDTVIYMPETFDGKPITHFGFYHKFEPGYERYHDWHHPSQGMEYEPPTYTLYGKITKPHSRIKRVVFPKTARRIFWNIMDDFNHKRGIIYEIDPENPYLTVVNNEIVAKKTNGAE